MKTFSRTAGLIMALGCVAWAQAQSITLTVGADTLGDVIPAIGKQAGTPLAVSPAIANEVIGLRASGVELDALMAQIAAATGFKWIPGDSGYILTRGQDVDAAAKQQMQRWTAELIVKAQQSPAPAPAQVTAGEDRGPAAGRPQGAPGQGGGPGGRGPGNAFAQIMGSDEQYQEIAASLPAQPLAQMDLGQRLVFSNRPNRYQKLAPTTAQRALTALGAQYKSGMQAALKQAQDALKQAEASGNAPRGMTERLQGMADMANRDVAKYLVVVTRNGLLTYSIQVQMLDQNGMNMGGRGTFLDLSRGLSSSIPFEVSPGVTNSPNATLLALMGSDRPDINQLTPDLRAKLNDPVTHEPWAPAGEIMLGALPQGQNVVISFPDEVFTQVAGLLGRGEVKSALSNPQFATTQENGWITITPAVKWHSWNTRRDRGEVKSVFAAFTGANPGLTLDTKAKFASTLTDWARPTGWEFRSLRLLAGGSNEGELRDLYAPNNEGLIMYAALRGKIGNQSTTNLPLNALSKGWLDWTVFNSPQGPMRIAQQEGQLALETGRGMQRGGPPGGRDFGAMFAQERTELLKDGLANQGQITVSLDVDQRVLARNSRTGHTITLSAEQLGMAMSPTQVQGRQRGEQLDITQFDEYAPVSEVEYRFTVTWADNTVIQRRADGITQAQKFGRYESLPAEFRETVQAVIGRMQEFANRRNERRPREVPPT